MPTHNDSFRDKSIKKRRNILSCKIILSQSPHLGKLFIGVSLKATTIPCACSIACSRESMSFSCSCHSTSSVVKATRFPLRGYKTNPIIFITKFDRMSAFSPRKSIVRCHSSGCTFTYSGLLSLLLVPDIRSIPLLLSVMTTTHQVEFAVCQHLCIWHNSVRARSIRKRQRKLKKVLQKRLQMLSK